MSESHLPDDAAKWPSDPYVLLGVDRSVDRRSLRQAYVRLIRIYRPEHYPDEFRRVREAYECLEQHLRYRECFGDDASAFATFDQGEAAFSPGMEFVLGEAREVTPDFASKSRTPAESAADVAWSMAVKGQAVEGYRRLRELERERPGNEELCLRLYWLLVLDPNLDRDRDRREWLAAGLSAAGLTGPLLELYGRELAGDPLEPQQPRCRNLLKLPAPLDQRAAFAMRCWKEIGVAGHWRLITQDLEELREEVAASDVTVWVRLLLACEEQLRWQHSHKDCSRLANACHREIERYSEEHVRLSWELDQADSLDVLLAGLREMMQSGGTLRETAERLSKLLRRNCVQPFGMIRDDLLVFLRPMVEEPIRALEQFDHIYQTSAAVLHQLNDMVQSLYHHRVAFRDRPGRAKERRKAVSAFFHQQKPDVYENWRMNILLFCLRDGMTFSQFQQAAADLPVEKALAEQWATDLPLYCITQACAAFWAADQKGAEVIELD